MQSGIMRIVGNSKEYPIDLSKGVDITYSNVSHSFLGVARVEKYLNGEAFDGLGEMVTATLSFEEVTAESSVRLTYFKHSLYNMRRTALRDASVPYVVCDGEVKFDGNLLIVPAANAWKNFAGTSELKVSVRAPSGILMNRESAAKAYTFEATDYGVYTISYGMGFAQLPYDFGRAQERCRNCFRSRKRNSAKRFERLRAYFAGHRSFVGRGDERVYDGSGSQRSDNAMQGGRQIDFG